MRNLQKILALVLALVMSLSLMATAGARDFTDGDQIDETFAESVDVLTGLEVFQGYPSGDFQPKGDITRAEVAAIIYRIATGDVTDSQVGIYADYNKFSDVPSDNWAAGYINYCANAEYIKGRGDGKFYPQDKVTGYEALAMILRVVGYDKNGEFTGADWQVQTAATANQRKVTKNVNAGTLGNPASRETVAELLCQAILIEKVNYTLAFGYQISTNPEDTIAYQTFKMEKLEGVVTGNEVADLKESSPLSAGQTRLVIDGREEIVDIPTTLDKIGKSVRAYIRPQGGTTRKQLVTADVYDTELNHVYDSFAPVSSVGNSTGSEQGINSIAGAEHFINYDFVNRWTATIRITYKMDLKWTEYDARTMRRDNGGHLWAYNPAGTYVIGSGELDGEGASSWATQLTSNANFTYHYENTIPLDEMLTSQDYENLYSIFTKADKTNPNSFILGEVYVGTTQLNNDISDDIRWTDFVNTYLVNKDNRAQVESNGRGNRLIIIDNDDDGIAEYVLQTIYTIAKITSDVKNVDIINQKLYDGTNSDAVNSTTSSNTLVPVSGKDLAKSEDALAAGDVVIYALIDGNIRAQKAETKTEKVNTVNRANRTITVVGEDAATYNQSAVHTHSNGLNWGVTGMVGNTTYTMYFDLDGNMAAYTEGANGGLVLITNGWNRNSISGPEYAVQAYLDGALQTVNVSTNGARFITRDNSNNQWGKLRGDFGNGTINGNNTIKTIVANLDGEVLTPVDQAYLYSQKLRMLDMVGNAIPGQNNVNSSWGNPYVTRGDSTTTYSAYNFLEPDVVSTPDVAGNRPNNTADKDYSKSYEVRSLASTVYYVVYNAHGTDSMTGGSNVVVRQYSSVPSLGNAAIEDVYAVGAKSVTATGVTYYTAQMVVIEVTGDYSRTSEQVFIPSFPEIGVNVKIENVPMIRNGELVTLAVDMEQSRTWDWYYTAGGATSGNSRQRLQGLYYLDPSDTDPDVYVIQRMSPKDIRDSGKYAIGYVRESWFGTGGTATSHYAQIEQLVRRDGSTDWKSNSSGYFGTNVQNAFNSTPKAPENGDLYKTANITDTSKFYTYNGTTATLDEDYNVLAQYRHDNAGTNVYGLNERIVWGVDASGNPVVDHFNNNVSQNYGNRNEVLVCYSGSNILYAVSFNDNEDGNNAAQVVWWNCLPIDGVNATSEPSFYGVTDNDEAGLDKAAANNTIEVNYSDVKGKDSGFNPGKNSDGSNATYHLVSGGEIPAKPNSKGATYVVVVTQNGQQTTWTLKVNEGSTNVGLACIHPAANGNTGLENLQANVPYKYPGTNDTTVGDFKSNFAPTPTDGIKDGAWTFYNGDMKDITSTVTDDTQIGNNWFITVVVTSEQGLSRTYQIYTGAVAPTLPVKTDLEAATTAFKFYIESTPTGYCWETAAGAYLGDTSKGGYTTGAQATEAILVPQINKWLADNGYTEYKVDVNSFVGAKSAATNTVVGGLNDDGKTDKYTRELQLRNANGDDTGIKATITWTETVCDGFAKAREILGLTNAASSSTFTDWTKVPVFDMYERSGDTVIPSGSSADAKFYRTEADAKAGTNPASFYTILAEKVNAAIANTSARLRIADLTKPWDEIKALDTNQTSWAIDQNGLPNTVAGASAVYRVTIDLCSKYADNGWENAGDGAQPITDPYVWFSVTTVTP